MLGARKCQQLFVARAWCCFLATLLKERLSPVSLPIENQPEILSRAPTSCRGNLGKIREKQPASMFRLFYIV